ncbi:TolC family protein [Hyalangium rubrum]|uniref:TolC family protein n=1 Tax=Hyalangium rubrum TaxID=3103134 RepID=A0ABU5GXP8_9BACT|nr:TolC family protein [Hyalangium sp. s54d21]MDY7225639.1 TolC family protein [Hyalangium sp. s54d21]
MLALTPATSAAQQEQEPGWVSMSLEEARTRALKYSPQIAQASGAIRTAQAAERTAFGAYLPSLSVSAGSSLASSERFNPDTNTPVTGSSDSYNAGLSASWDVFTGFRRRNTKKQAEANTHAAQAQLVEQRFSVALSVERSFFDGLRAEELMVVARARIERAQEGVGAAERRLAVGSATRSDVLRSQLELNTARESLLQLENQRYTAGLSLGRLVGVEGPVDPAPSGPTEPTPLEESGAALVASLVSAAPSVRAAEAIVVAAEASIGVARAQYLPSVRLSAGYDWFNDDPVPAGGRTSWSVRLGLSYPIFDGFQRDANEIRARTQAEIAQSQLADVRRLARAEAERVLSLLKLAEERISLARQAVQVAQEDLRVQQERYRLGATTILELLTSQSALVEAENNLVSLRFDYQLSRAELEAIAGREL